MLLPIANAYGSTILKILLAFLFVFFIELANGLQAGFTGIILGHKMNNSKTGFSVLFGFLSYGATQVFGLLTIFIISLFNKDLMNLFITNEIINMEMLKVIIYLAITIYSMSFIIVYLVNIKLFKQGINVD